MLNWLHGGVIVDESLRTVCFDSLLFYKLLNSWSVESTVVDFYEFRILDFGGKGLLSFWMEGKWDFVSAWRSEVLINAGGQGGLKELIDSG